MNIQKIKTILIAMLGDKAVAYIQAVRFIYLLKTGKNTEPDIQLIHAFLKKGDIAIDVGANGANWTYYLHQCVGDAGEVFAFEADPYYAMATGITIKLLGLKSIQLFSFGLSNKSEDVPLRVSNYEGLRDSGFGYIDKDTLAEDERVIMVHLETLDSLIQGYPQLLKTALIKCDVEGYELFVFQGANQILNSSRPFVILESGNFEKQGYTAQDIYHFFIKRHYACFVMVGKNTLATTDTMMKHDRAVSVNRVFIPQERVAFLQDIIQ